MRTPHPLLLALLPALAIPLGCTEDPADDDTTPGDDDTTSGDDDTSADRDAILAVPATSETSLPGLAGTVHVVRTASDIPHIYVEDPDDLQFALGFVCARDRFFMMELGRRLALGRVSELLGDAALTTDIQSRTAGFTKVAQRIHDGADAVGLARLARYADGVNAWLDLVRAGSMPVPPEIELLAALTGAGDAASLLADWTALDVAAMAATVVYEAAFDAADLSNQDVLDRLPGLYDGQALGALREAGAWADLFELWTPTYPVASAYGFGLDGAGSGAAAVVQDGLEPSPGAPPRAGVSVEAGVLARARARLAALTARLGHDEQGWGSNAWAAGSTLTRDGVAILASDGHLPLSVPALFFQAHLDDALFGGGEHTLAGLVIPGVPNLGVGTNGQVAWSQTQFSGDQVDYYREEIVLGAGGLPESRVFQGGTRPLVAVIESYRIADAPALGSEGRTEVADRFETDDGRVLVSLEGTPVSGSDAEVGPGQAVVNIDGDWLVPGDVDGDGAVTAISFDFNAFDIGDMMRVTAAFGEAQDIDEWFDATRGIVTYSQSLIAADVHGNVLFTGYEGMPCRTYLPRTDGGRFEAGADPRYLVDGTLYPGFEIPTDAEGNVDETAAEPERCVVPWDRFPHALNPERGYVANANNDPGAIGFDNDLYNDEYYLGGPWPPGHRANRIEERLVERAGEIDADVFSDIQADRQSLLGREFASYLLAAVQAGRAASISVAPTPGDERLAALYEARAAQLDEVEARIADWEARSWPAMSGVETFYHQPDEQERVDAVATMLFNAWWPRFVNGVFDDEGLPGVFKPWGTDGRARGLLRMLRGAAPGNPEGLASFDEATGQSAFFDVLWTDGVTERWEEVALDAMNDGLAFLEGPDGGDGTGGFGTAEMAQWLWGLRHYVEFDSIVADFLGDDPLYAAIIDQFSITPDLLPIAASIPSGDPRRDLPGYPRPGDNLAVDAANTGTDETGFDYGSGPVMRLVVSLYSDGPRIRNVLPGGQSADPDSPFFADQAALWLGNQAIDVPFRAADVAAQAVGREVLVP